MGEFGFIGFDLWQVKAGTFIDNLIITDDEAEADKFAAKWKDLQKHELEQKEKPEEKKEEAEKDDDDDIKDDDDKKDVDVAADDKDDDEDL